MKKEEKNIIELQKHGFGKTLKLSKNEFESFDAFNDNVIIEFKERDQEYNEQLVEGMKLFKNYHIAQSTNKDFYYIVFTPKYILIWNINTYFEENQLLFSRRSLPATTEFKKTKWIYKMVTYLETNKTVKKIER